MRQSRIKVMTMLILCFNWKVLSITFQLMPLWAKQLIRSTTSMFFISWETQYDKNGSSYGQLVIGSFITTTSVQASRLMHEFVGKTSNPPGDSAPLQPRFGTLQLLTFPKTKISFEREEISNSQWDLGKYGAAGGDSNKGFCRGFWTVEETLRELCEVQMCLLWRGLRCHCPTHNVSCILCLLQYFS